MVFEAGLLRIGEAFPYVLSRPTVTVAPTMPIRIAIRLQSYKGYRHLPVVAEDNRVLGMVAAADLINLLGGGPLFEEVVRGIHGGSLYEAVYDQVARVSKKAWSLNVKSSISSLLGEMGERGVGAVVLTDEGERLRGLVTLRDVVHAIAARRKPLGVRVSELMTANPITLPAGGTLLDAMRIMTERGVRRIPILDEERGLAGVVSNKDIIRFFDQTYVLEAVKSGALHAFHKERLAHIMRTELKTVKGGRDVIEAARILSAFEISGLPVVEGSELKGIFTERDLVIKGHGRLGAGLWR